MFVTDNVVPHIYISHSIDNISLNMKGNGSTNWRLKGDYFDGCNCKSICPCVFMLDSTEGDCKAVGAWLVQIKGG
jgi:hypothetical protein